MNRKNQIPKQEEKMGKIKNKANLPPDSELGQPLTPKKRQNSEHESELFGLTEHSTEKEQLVVLVKQSFPVAVSFFLTIGGSFVNLVFAGHFVEVEGDKGSILAGISLANMFANVSCLSILIGMSSAIETLGSQHNGAGNYREVGILLQRSLIILTVLTLPIFILWFFVADIFRALGVEESVCAVVQSFIRIRSLTLPMDIINESYEKYLAAIGVMNPSMWANLVFNFAILFFDVVFIYVFQLGYECLAWSWVLSLYISGFIQIGLSLKYPEVKRTLQPYDKAVWQNWKEFIMLGLPGTIMLCSEWWAYEILTVFASLLGTAQVAAQSIILQTTSFAFMVPLGMGVACASLVGNAIGADKISLAKSIGKLSIKSIFVLEVVVGVIMLIGGRYFVDMFTDDPGVKRIGARAIPFLSVFTMVDGIQGVSSGVLRGAGKQFVGAFANVFAFYGIGIPLSWTFCFKLNLGVNGLMLGIACGAIFQVVVLLSMVFFYEDYLYSSAIQPHGFEPLKDEDEYEDLSSHGIVMNELVRVNAITDEDP